MSRLFEVSPADIERLSSVQLAELLMKLLYLEASAFNIATSCVSTTLSITVSDDGEDGRIKWDGGIDHTNWFPRRFTLFQCKATDLTEKQCTEEICVEDGDTKRLKPSVREVFDAAGSYILFFTRTCDQKMIDKRIKGFRKGIKDCNLPYADTANIQIYDANKISKWTNQYIAAITKVLEFTGRHIPTGALTWGQWSQYKDNNWSYETDNTLDSYISQIRSFFSKPKKVARITGLSGLGKTRLALEAFRPPDKPEQDFDQYAKYTQVVYINAEKAPQGLSSEIISWRNEKVHGIIIVDNCELSLHKQLAEEIGHNESLLSLLTLDYTPEQTQNDEAVIEIKPVSDEVIKKIIQRAYPNLQENDVNRIVEFSEGFPRMAVLLAEARLNEEDSIGNIKDYDLVKKLLWGTEGENKVALDVISACAIFDHIGFFEDKASERNFASEKVCKQEISNDAFFENAQYFIDKGILDIRGRYVRVTPRPLAIRLAADWWRKCSPERARNLILEDMPPGMAEALCDQMAKLHFLKEAQDLTKALCGEQSPFGQAEVLNSEKGSRLFRSLVEVSPGDTVKALWYAFGDLSKNDLLQVGPGRRNLVWALVKLCFWEETFFDAAKMMMKFAISENESWGNNATNQFLQLFHIYLSGTQAPLSKRFELIDYALSMEEYEYVMIAIKALAHVLETHNFMRLGGVEAQGSRNPMEDWQPRTYEEVFDYWRKGLSYLTQIALADDKKATEAQKEIASKIRGLVQYGLMKELNESIRSINTQLNGYWPDGLEAVEDAIQYEGPQIPVAGQILLQEWLELLKPKSLADRLKLTIGIPSWNNYKELDDGTLIDLSELEATNLALEFLNKIDELYDYIQIVFSGEQRQGFLFGLKLGQGMKEHYEFIEKSICALEEAINPNPVVLAGYLSGIKKDDQKAVSETLDRISHSKKLSTYLVDITRLTNPEEADFQRIFKLVDKKMVTIESFNSFSYGSVLSHLSLAKVFDLIDKLVGYGIDGAIVALNVLFMYCHNDNKKFELSHKKFYDLLTYPELTNYYLTNKKVDFYHWQKTYIHLLDNDSCVELAKDISNKIIGIIENKNYMFELNHKVEAILTVLFLKYKNEVWPIYSNALLGENKLLTFHLVTLLKGDMKFKKDADSLVMILPNDFLIDWLNEYQIKAAKILCSTLKIIIGQDSIHPVIKYILDSKYINEEILENIFSNFGPHSWWGSIIPFYQQQLAILNQLQEHTNIIIKIWADKKIKLLQDRIMIEQQKEDEQEFE